MSLTHIRKPALIVLSLLLALAVLSLAPQPAAPASGGSAIALKAPSFVRVANAQEGVGTQEEPAAAPMGFPQDEAGISAYFHADGPIDLEMVRAAFRTIEVQTLDYLIGSVAVPDYPETEDVHVYVHKDGWFLAYYLKSDPVGKIYDWKDYYHLSGAKITTKLENTLARVVSFAAVPFPGGTYYDFRYPNATHMILIAESELGTGTDSFEVNLPATFSYYERSWSTATTNCRHTLNLDGNVVSTSDGTCGWLTFQGTLSAAQLLPNTFHTFAITAWANGDAYAGLALVYRVP